MGKLILARCARALRLSEKMVLASTALVMVSHAPLSAQETNADQAVASEPEMIIVQVRKVDENLWTRTLTTAIGTQTC